jgi:hypothetical protein
MIPLPSRTRARAARTRIVAIAAAAAAIAAAVFASAALARFGRPALESIEPSVGNRGELVEIRGRGFGSVQGDGQASFAGVRPTESSYLSWSDNLIRVRVPETTSSGLVNVVTRRGRSNSLLFTDRDELPVPVAGRESPSTPAISSMSPSSGAVGTLVSLSGSNFGQSRSEGRVVFSASPDPEDRLQREGGSGGSIQAPPGLPDVELWSDSLIRLRIPDGAVSGVIRVETSRGASAPAYLEVMAPAGMKTYRNRKTYHIAYYVEVSDLRSSGKCEFCLWIPRPAESDAQRSLMSVNASRTPDLSEYDGAMLHRFVNPAQGRRIKVSHEFSLDAYEVRTQARVEALKPAPADSPYLAFFGRPEAGLPSDDPSIKDLAAKVLGKEKNPWRQAKLAYDWLGSSFRADPADSRSTALTALRKRSGDAYGEAMLLVALLRAGGVPARPVSGVRIDSSRTAETHYWAEFRADGLGWIPIDPVFGHGPLGEAAPSSGAREGMPAKEYYFGNLDNDRIAFSRGFQRLLPQMSRSRLVPADRGYSLHSIREELSPSIQTFTSFWSPIEVKGIY